MDDPKVGKWLKKIDGPMKRLRRDIIRAEKFDRGGTYHRKRNPLGIEMNNFPRKRFKAKEISEILTKVLEIEVSIDDVTNDRKAKYFEQNQTPRTKEVYEKLYKLKMNVFPYLEIETFLTSKTGYSIDSCELNDCIHSQRMYQLDV